jgi:hypothetical protein
MTHQFLKLAAAGAIIALTAASTPARADEMVQNLGPDAETGMTTAARVRVSLSPRQMVGIDSSDNQTLNLQCGDYAKTLAVVGDDLELAANQ